MLKGPAPLVDLELKVKPLAVVGTAPSHSVSQVWAVPQKATEVV